MAKEEKPSCSRTWLSSTPQSPRSFLDKAISFANDNWMKGSKGEKVTWQKKNCELDVTMGAPDGAEVCELVGLFLLH